MQALQQSTGPELQQDEPKNFSPSPDFKWLCEELFKQLDDVPDQRKKQGSGSKPVSVRYYEIINNFLNLWRRTVGNDIFPAMVLILPYRDRRVYNIKDYTLVKAVCNYLKLSTNSLTEKRLLRWKKRATKGVRLSDFCVEEIKKRKRKSPQQVHITIDELNECLKKLSEERNIRGKGPKGISGSSTFNFCLENLSFLELKYFFDIILKNRVIGGQEHKFLNCWHPDASDYLSVVSDLKLVANKLWNPSYRLKKDDLNVNIGHAFVPHLAKKLSMPYEKICNKLGNDFYIEEKMDGERIQLHYMDYGMKLKFFSRRGFDYTYLYGESLRAGTISPFLKLHENVKECVLDGEMVTFDVERNTVLPFGLVKSSAKNALTTEGICSQNYRPLFMVLDLVYLNGTSLTKLPLHQRKVYLRDILTPYPNKVDILPYSRCSDPTAIKRSLQTAISVGSEGIILKKYSSKYIFGARNDNCIKIKPEYLEQFGENMDLVVIGRTPGKKDSLMCALAVYEGQEDTEWFEGKKELVDLDFELKDADGDEQKRKIKKFVSFCIIANGISQEEFKDIDRRTRGFWKKTDEIEPPSDWLEFGSKIPEEWIDPRNSIVIEVKARSLDNTESNEKKFKAGCTLYGGYCRRIRPDKDWTTSYSLYDLYQERRNKFSPLGNNEKQTLMTPKKIKKNEMVVSLGMQSVCTGIHSTDTEIFRGLYFYVLSDYFDHWCKKRISKEQINTYVVRNGGKVISNLIAKRHAVNHYRVISGKSTTECKVLADRGYDIISPCWILDCITSKSLVKIEPQHCFKVSKLLMKVARNRVDIFGDSYVTPISERRLKSILNHASDHVYMKEIEQPATPIGLQDIPLFLFNGRTAFLPDKISPEIQYDVAEKVKDFGGKIASDIYSCNLIIVSEAAIERNSQLMKKLRSEISSLGDQIDYPPQIPYIVKADWVSKSIEKGYQLPEEDFGIY